MKKRKVSRDANQVGPEDAVRFIEGMREMLSSRSDPTVAISIRVPKNLLASLKLKAKIEGKKYQSLAIELIRIGLVRKIGRAHV